MKIRTKTEITCIYNFKEKETALAKKDEMLKTGLRLTQEYIPEKRSDGQGYFKLLEDSITKTT